MEQLRKDVLDPHPSNSTTDAKTLINHDAYSTLGRELVRPKLAVKRINMMGAAERGDFAREIARLERHYAHYDGVVLVHEKAALLARIDHWLHSGHAPSQDELKHLREDVETYCHEVGVSLEVQKWLPQYKHLLVNRRPPGSDNHLEGDGKWLSRMEQQSGSGKKGGKGSVAFKRKVAKVMREFEDGILRSSNGRKVRSRKQAVAIALSEARRL